MKELIDLGVTYINSAWFKDGDGVMITFQIEKTKGEFHFVLASSFDGVNDEIKKVIRELKKGNQNVRKN